MSCHFSVPYTVFVRSPLGDVEEMEVVQDTSIEQLKAFIEERYGESEDTQKLEFEGKPISYLFGKA